MSLPTSTLLAGATGLAKYQPLPHILCYDDFDRGSCGWFDLKPNHTQPGFRPLKSVIDKTRWGPTMISSASYGYAGTHGSMDGLYSLKLTTRPIAARYEEPPPAGSLGVAIKRLPFHRPHKHWQFEMFYAYTPEQDRIGLGEQDIRAFGMFFDIQDDEHRYQPGLRYVNSVNGQLKQQLSAAQAYAQAGEHAALDHLLDGQRVVLVTAPGFPGGVVTGVSSALTQAGASREEAYRLVQRNAMKVWRGEGDFLAFLKADPDVSSHLPDAALEAMFDEGYHFKHVDTIFERVFGKA